MPITIEAKHNKHLLKTTVTVLHLPALLPVSCDSWPHCALATKHSITLQLHVHLCHMAFSYTYASWCCHPLPAMVIQKSVTRSNIRCPSCTSSHSGVHHVHTIPCLSMSSGVEWRVVMVLLLLLSGDIEKNPGPVLSVADLHILMKELNNVRANWNNIGLQLGVNIGTLDAIKKQYNDPSDCLRETLTTWLKSSHPTWSNIVDALRVVGEMRLAADLECKYCSTQDIGTAATHHLAPPVPAVPPSQAHTWMTSPPQSNSLTRPPVFGFPYFMPPQSHPFYPSSWPAPYYYTPPTSYPPFLPPAISGAVSTATPASIHSMFTQLCQVTPGPIQSGPVPPTLAPAQPTTSQFPTSDALQAVTVSEQPEQPTVIAGMQFQH